MNVNKVFESMAKSNIGQKFYKWAASPGKDKFLNTTLPTFETVVATGLYCWSTARQKNIEKPQRDLLQTQNILSGVAGVIVGTITNRHFYKKTEEVIKHLDPTKLDPKTLRKTSDGLRVITPMICTAAIMRWITPSITACLSGKIMDRKREKESPTNSSVREAYNKHLKEISKVNNRLNVKA